MREKIRVQGWDATSIAKCDCRHEKSTKRIVIFCEMSRVIRTIRPRQRNKKITRGETHD